MIVATTQRTAKKQSNKVRFVRTKEGERRFGKPIGSVIVSDTNMENIKYLGNTKNGWGVFKGKNGKRYQVGKIDGLWVATPFGDYTRKHSLVEGGALQATLKALNRRAGNKAEKREDTEYDRNKRAGRTGTLTGEKKPTTSARKTSAKKKATTRKTGTTNAFAQETGTGSSSSSSRSAKKTSSSKKGSTSKAKATKKITKKKGDYTGPNLKGLRRLVNAGIGGTTNGAERAAAAKVMKELEKQGLVKRTKVKGKTVWRPADGYSASDVSAGATESSRIDQIMFELQKSEEKAMRVAHEIEARANAVFAEFKGLRLYDGHKGHISSLQQKDMSDGMEEKVRRVRTPAGVRRFGLPIGAIIGSRGKQLKNIKILDPVFDDWDLVEDTKGKKYDVGKDDDGKWRAFGHNDWDDLVVESDSEDGVFEALNDKLGGGASKPATVKKPQERFDPDVLRAYQSETTKFSNALKDFNKSGATPKDRHQALKAMEESIKAREAMDIPESNRSRIKMDQDVLDRARKRDKEGMTNPNAPTPVAGSKRRAGRAGQSASPTQVADAERAAKRNEKNNEKIKKTQENISDSRRTKNAIYDKLTSSQKAEYDNLSDEGKKRYMEVRKGSSRFPQLMNHRGAMDAVKRQENMAARRQARSSSPTESEQKEVTKTLRTTTQRNQYRRLRARGTSHQEALKQAKAYRPAGPSASEERQQWLDEQAERRRNGDVRRAVDSRRIANSTQGANKPKAERSDAEIEAGLNNAFREQFNTLSGSQKRKYFAAFREGKTHSEAMAAARGDSGKAQGTLF